MHRRLLLIDAAEQNWRLATLQVEALDKDPREDYFVLSGETLCQYLLRRDRDALVLARGPLPFLSGNKASVGYVSPLTGLPHYSFVGGRVAAQMFNLGLDSICLQGIETESRPAGYVVIGGRAPNLTVEFRSAADLPAGQRSAYYWLLEQELNGDRYAGSILTLGEGARLGYRAANLAADAIYHAGRGGAGAVFARFLAALVLQSEPIEPGDFFPDDSPRSRNPNAIVAPLLDKYCARLSSKTGGTITKLQDTGGDLTGKNTLPALNAQQLGYALADLGGERVLRATREGQTGCHWCQVDCRHYHWLAADYAPEGRDLFLDDFEPTYAIFAMLGLVPAEDTLQARLDLLDRVNQQLILPIEQMGCDIIDIGVGLATLLEAVGRNLIPVRDVPDFIVEAGGLNPTGADIAKDERTSRRLEAAVRAVDMLRTSEAAWYPALRALGNGPQALAEAYPEVQRITFTAGPRTLANAGHSNALWTFLMPFSRFFGHYVGQYYKVDAQLPPPGSDQAAYRACFRQVVEVLLQREFFWLLGNALSQCAFTFVVFSEDGQGEQLGADNLLVRVLCNYGIRTTRDDLQWFSQAFWAQSIDLKCQFGWHPPSAAELPHRVYEALSLALDRGPDELQVLMELLIQEWKQRAKEVMQRFGYLAPW